jgi:16S rRNA (cytidine1402-2'-O)-methyltransferase
MPGISDPGADLIKLSIEEDIEVVVLPGATASITALVASGLNTRKFVFEGFLPSKKKDRIKALETLVNEKRTIIFYESPHRVINSMEDMLEVLGNRNIAVCRELTKHYEEILRGNFETALKRFNQDVVKGEFVIIVEGNTEVEKEEINIEEELIRHLENGLTKKEAIKKVVEEKKIPKNIVYSESLKLNKK